MDSEALPLDRLRGYVAKVKELDHNIDSPNGDDDEYEVRIKRTLQSLQNRVNQQKATIEKLRAEALNEPFNEPSPDPKERIQQLRTITATYKSLAQAEPLLPLPESPLPALLALRSTLNLVDQTKNSVTETHVDIKKARNEHQQAITEIGSAKSLTQALEKRIERLRLEYGELSQKTFEDVARNLLEEEQQQKEYYEVELRTLIKAFNKFVDDHLAAMIAAEDLGGPVVGDLLEITDDVLRAGFTQQGNQKKIRSENQLSDVKRKQRNNAIWGDGERRHEMARSEREAAGASCRSLTEDLLNAAVDEDSSDSYIQLTRESAAVRFLVRAKVAQFHPTDARKLRLVDFGRKLND